MPSYCQGGAFSPFGLAVKISQPSSVIPMLCSNWAASERSRVTAVQPSASILTAYLPVLIIGSIVNNKPGFSSGQIGRASSRERVCQYVSISGVDVSLKKKNGTNPSAPNEKTQQAEYNSP